MDLSFIRNKLKIRGSKSEDEIVEKKPTVLGKSMTIKGKIEGEDDVRMMGTHTGDYDITGKLDIDTDAHVTGTIHADVINLKGKVDGKLTAGSGIYILDKACVNGEIHTPIISISKGTTVNGKIDMERS